MANEDIALEWRPVQGKKVREDLLDRTFGRLTVRSLDPVRSKSGRARWVCICECGNEKVVEALNLKQGKSTSCGCYNKDQIRDANSTHGLSARPEYSQWKAMRKRCNNSNSGNFDRYGGRGIRVCTRWSDFSAFLDDMGPRPSDVHTIERKDHDGDYEPKNCHWAIRLEQALNTGRSIILEDGSSLAAAIISSGLRPGMVYHRIRRGWSAERALKP